jgi:hypothetical protein
MGSNTPIKNRIQQTASIQKLMDGLNKNAATVPSFLIDGVAVARADIVTKLQGLLDASKNVETTRANWQNAVATNTKLWRDDAMFLSGLRQSLLIAFRGQVSTLADFGLTGRKVGTSSTQTKVAAAVKRQATRVARHTMGKKQKEAIVGNPPAYTVVPVTGASTSAQAPDPSAPAPGTSSPSPVPPASNASAPAPVTAPLASASASSPATAPASPPALAPPASVPTAAPAPAQALASPPAALAAATSPHVT